MKTRIITAVVGLGVLAVVLGFFDTFLFDLVLSAICLIAIQKQRTERVPKRILTEEEMSALSDRLMQVTKGMTITVRYFKEDTTHPEIPAVGNYITLTGKADRIDPVFRTLQVGDTVVPFENLVKLSGEGIMDIDAYLGIGEGCV